MIYDAYGVPQHRRIGFLGGMSRIEPARSRVVNAFGIEVEKYIDDDDTDDRKKELDGPLKDRS